MKMGIGNHELIEHEQNNFEELSADFIKERKEEFEQFLAWHIKSMTEQLEQDFCSEHKDWGQFVLDDYNNRQTGGE